MHIETKIRQLKLKDEPKIVEFCCLQDVEIEFEDEVDILMSNDIIMAQMSTKDVQFERAQSGWFVRQYKREMVGPFRADVYSVSGIR